MIPEDRSANLGLATPKVAALCHVPVSTLNHWVSTGLCYPTLIPSGGRRATKYWSIRDVVVVRAIKSLRNAGCSLQNVRTVAGVLEKSWGRNLSDSVLFWDGSDVISVDETGAVVSLLQESGQAIMRDSVVHLLTFPLGAWIDEARAAANVVPTDSIVLRREQRQAVQGVETKAALRRGLAG